MAAITGVLAATPLTLSNAIASADYERVTSSVPSAPFAPAGFAPAPDAAPENDAPAAPGTCPSAPDVAPVADTPPAPAHCPRPQMHRPPPRPMRAAGSGPQCTARTGCWPRPRCAPAARPGCACQRRPGARAGPGARAQGLQRQLGRDRFLRVGW